MLLKTLEAVQYLQSFVQIERSIIFWHIYFSTNSFSIETKEG